MADLKPDLGAVQEIFGGSIAGNHTVHVRYDDGSVLCSCTVDELGGRLWFLGHDEALSDWDLVDPLEARKMISDALDELDKRG